ncbi:MAG: 50S ribosomal protein L30 [Clostridiales Family XIII bacterium]|jgi:large subunit ribosomal protein L30|nr:50S ribosomal protein L30 [Clostridiales Family XIII bacterium]
MAKAAEKTIKITLTKSPIGSTPAQKKVVAALGLRKMHQTVELVDSPVTRGAVNKVAHLLTVKE